MKKILKKYKKPLVLFFIIKNLIYLIIFLCMFNACSIQSSAIAFFPIEKYSQDLNTWFPADDPDFQKPLLTEENQKLYFEQLKRNLFGTTKNSYSPWSPTYIARLLAPEEGTDKNIWDGESTVIGNYIKHQNKFFGINFKVHPTSFLTKLQDNMNIDNLKGIEYKAENRAILVDNVLIRAVPTQDPFFKDLNMAGEGYPFDYNRMSSLLAGSPIYVINYSKDHAWVFVLSSVCMGWIPSSAVKLVSEDFVKTWQKAIEKQMGSIIGADVPVIDTQTHQFYFYGYVGTLLPIKEESNESSTLLVPVGNAQNQAEIKEIILPTNNVVKIPLTLSKKNFKLIISQTIGRPYGWGNLNFYNDCSSELRYMYFCFGIFMPRNSTQQSNFLGTVIDASSLSARKRYATLKKQGNPLLSLVFIPGHIILYIGNYKVGKTMEIMSFQDIWGMKPPNNSKRYIIGKSIIFPLKLRYPERRVVSFFDKHRKIFKIVQLAQFQEHKPLLLSQLLY